VRSHDKSAKCKAEEPAFAVDWEILNGIGEIVRIEDIDTVPGPGDILVEPSGLSIPDGLFQSILADGIFVVT
jgi:hypothetical protein